MHSISSIQDSLSRASSFLSLSRASSTFGSDAAAAAAAEDDDLLLYMMMGGAKGPTGATGAAGAASVTGAKDASKSAGGPGPSQDAKKKKKKKKLSPTDAVQRQLEAYRRLAENGPPLLIMVLIQALSTQTFLMYAERKKKNNSNNNKPPGDVMFIVWYAFFNVVFACAVAYAAWRKWLPALPMRAYFGIFAALPGLFVSVCVEYTCRLGDKGVTTYALQSKEAYHRRIWMHALIGIVVSVAVVIMLTSSV
jgi:cobalamin biosynthesis Mg chelatase CobN